MGSAGFRSSTIGFCKGLTFQDVTTSGFEVPAFGSFRRYGFEVLGFSASGFKAQGLLMGVRAEG